MANGDVQPQVSAEYLQQFNLPLGVSGMQKLSEFPTLQQLGYNGQLNSIKADFHGLADFNQQMAKYSSASAILEAAWSLISAIAPNNINIARELISSPGLGTVGQMFQSITGFAQIFSLSPSDLSSPASTNSATSVYKNASTQSSVTTTNSSTTQVGGGAGITPSSNTNQVNGVQVIGTPTPTNNSLVYNGTNLVWSPGGSGGGSVTLTGEFSCDDGTFTSPGTEFTLDEGNF